MKKVAAILLTLATLMAPLPSQSQTSQRVSLLGQVAFPNLQTGDVWASGDYVFVARRGAGLSIVDVSDPRDPQIVFEQDFGLNQDVKVSGRYAFLTNEASNGTVGLYILDISDPPRSHVVGTVATPEISSVHNVYAAGDYVYLVSNSSADVRIIDVSDPTSPRDVGRFSAGFGFPHDITVIGNRMYAAFLSGGLQIVDVSDKSAPQRLAGRAFTGAVTHNIWPTRDGRFVLTTDETPDGHIRVWDVSDFGNINEVGSYRSKPNIIVHNVLVDRDLAYIAYYVEGLQIIDISDPTHPARVGFYDTFDGPDDAGFNGAWGVYPYGKQIYVSDINTGLYILEFDGRKTGTLVGRVIDRQTEEPLDDAKIEVLDKPVGTFTDSGGSYLLTTTVDTVHVVFSSRGYRPDTVHVAFVADDSVRLDVALMPRSITSVERTDTGVPRSFSLSQNFPNPFNPKTTISLELYLPARVRLVVYDVLGREIRALVDGRLSAGRHRVLFEASELPSGIYVYRAEIRDARGRFVQTRKMALVK